MKNSPPPDCSISFGSCSVTALSHAALDAPSDDNLIQSNFSDSLSTVRSVGSLMYTPIACFQPSWLASIQAWYFSPMVSWNLRSASQLVNFGVKNTVPDTASSIGWPPPGAGALVASGGETL